MVFCFVCFVFIKKHLFFDIISLLFLQMIFHIILSDSFSVGSSSLKPSVTSFKKLVLIAPLPDPQTQLIALLWLPLIPVPGQGHTVSPLDGRVLGIWPSFSPFFLPVPGVPQ